MTAAAGVALSHRLSPHRLGGNISSESDAATRLLGRRHQGHRQGKSFQLPMHGAHELSAATAGPTSYSVTRITCSNLVKADDDFVSQYS
jgi:hypothetical protein